MRYDQRIAAAQERISAYARQIADNRARYAELQQEAEDKESAADASTREAVQARYKKRLDVARRRVESLLDRRKRAQEALGKIKAQMEVARRKREWNTSTSLKSYVDPRVYQRWGERVRV